MTARKKPAKRARKPKHKVVRGLEESLVSTPLKPGTIVEWERHAPRKWGFWKRVWVSLFGA